MEKIEPLNMSSFYHPKVDLSKIAEKPAIIISNAPKKVIMPAPVITANAISENIIQATNMVSADDTTSVTQKRNYTPLYILGGTAAAVIIGCGIRYIYKKYFAKK